MAVELPTGTVTLVFTDIEGRAMTFDRVLDYAAAWADQRSGGAT